MHRQEIVLPPELFRSIITHVLVTTRLQESVHLRLVCRLFDDEFMAVLEQTQLLQKRVIRNRRRETKGFDQFVTTYLLRLPQQQRPWHDNMSAALNHLVDAVLRLNDDHPRQDGYQGRRRQHLLCLYRAFLLQEHRIIPLPANLPNHSRQSTTDLAAEWALFLVLAEILVGSPVLQHQDSRDRLDAASTSKCTFLGTTLGAAFCAARPDVARYILERDLEQQGLRPPNPAASMHLALVSAASNDDMESVRLLFDPRWAISVGGPDFQVAMVHAIRLGRRAMVEYLLDRADEKDQPLHHVTHDGLREAAYNGDEILVGWLLDRAKPDQLDLESTLACASNTGRYLSFLPGSDRLTPFQAAAKQGHEGVLRALMQRGAKASGPYPRPNVLGSDQSSSLCCAACGGHVSCARFILDAAIKPIASDWALVFMRAAEFGHANLFLRSLTLSGHFDLGALLRDAHSVPPMIMLAICRYGDVEAVEFLADNGVPVKGPSYYGDHQTPMTVAVIFDQRDVIQSLKKRNVDESPSEKALQTLRDSGFFKHWLQNGASRAMHPNSRAGITFPANNPESRRRNDRDTLASLPGPPRGYQQPRLIPRAPFPISRG